MNPMTCKKLVLSSAAALVFALAGCGGASNTTANTDALSGVAAVGNPIANGAVNIQCAGGNAIASTTTGNDGVFQFNLTGQTLPCAVQVSGGTVNSVTNATPYHSIAVTVGTVNVTPITDLLVANLAATATPSTWFTALGTSRTPLTTINQTAVDASVARIRSTLSALTPLATLNPVTSAFTAAAGNSMDDTLAAFKAAMTTASVSYSTLLSAAATPAFTAPTGFGAALGNTFAATVSGGSMVVPAAPASGGGANANALSSGTDYGIIYSGSANQPPAGPNPGIDNRTPISAEFDSAGNMTGYTASVSEAPTIGSASVGELATDGIMSIGRWTNGALAGAFYSVLPVFDAHHGLHYAVTKPTLISALPTTGTVTYQLAAVTKPTYLDGHAAPGTLTGSAAVNFETKTVGLDLIFTFSDVTYTLTTAGGVATPGTSIVALATGTKAFGSGFSFGGLLTGGTCGTGCSVNIRIVFGGAAGERLGVVVQGGTLPMILHGAAMFNKP